MAAQSAPARQDRNVTYTCQGRWVEAGTAGSRWLRTRSFQPSTRCHSRACTSGCRRTRPCLTAAQRFSRTGPASGGRSRVSRCRIGSRTRSRWAGPSSSDAADVPSHGALPVHGARLPVQAGGPQGRAVRRGVVGRHAPHTPFRQDREPVIPVAAGTAQAQVQPCPLRVGFPTGGHGLHVPPQGGGAHPATQQGQDAGEAPETDAVHVQIGHQLTAGLRALAGGHAGGQGRGTAEAGLALPALDVQGAQHDQVTG